MSKFIPASAVAQEKYQQMLRAKYGTKIGTHVYFPDAEIGPYILRKDRLATLEADGTADTIRRAYEASLQAQVPDNTAKKLKRGFKKLFGGIK